MDHMVVGAGMRHPSLGDSTEFEKEANLSLSDRLKPFKSSQFDSDGFINSKCRSMAEKELRHLTIYLKELQKASAEEMRKSVYANYAAFIRTAKEISALEGQLLSLRNLLSSQAAVVHGLADGVHVNSLSPGLHGPSDEDTSNRKSSQIVKIESWLKEFLETLEVLLAERRVEEALIALDEGDKVVQDANDRGALNPTMLISLQNAITKSRLKLADQLVETASQSSTKGTELRTVVLALKRLGDGPRAHTLLLKAHHQKLHLCMQAMKPAGNASSGGVYCTSLAKLVFSAIAQASSDSLAVFGEDTSYTSELVSWAVKETEEFGRIVMKQSLYASAASGKLRAAAECVQVSLGHCVLLESRGMALSPVLLKHFKPLTEQALTVNLKRIEQNTAALAASDDWCLVLPPGAVVVAGVSSSFPKLSKSAHRFNSMVQDLFEDVEPLDTLQLVTPLLEGVLQVFNSYINMLTNAFPVSVNEANPEGTGVSIVKEAVTEEQQLALLANALLLSDESLPRAAAKLLSIGCRDDVSSRRDLERQKRVAEQRDWKKRVQKSVDRLRDSFCRQHALELIFTEEGEVRLTAQLYTNMDGYAEEPEWFPSSIFQELFMKLTHIATIAADMFVGRERFATILLMRLTETVILYLSDDQAFWEEIEQGQKPLGPFGLQQFYLDMEFVILFASQGRFLSRSLQQVAKDIIARAIDAVSASGIDPYSSLPEDEWFAEVAQMAVTMFSGKQNFESEDRDPVSPTASMSTKSISSAISHGST